MMPDQDWKRHLLEVLEQLDQRNQGGLSSLGIICRVRQAEDLT